MFKNYTVCSIRNIICDLANLIFGCKGLPVQKNYLIILIEGAFKSVGHPIDFFAQEAKDVTINSTTQSFARF